MEPEMLGPQAIARLAKVSSDLRVTVLGKAGQSLELTGSGGGPIQTEDVSALTEEQRDARRKAIVAELARRAGMSIVDKGDDDDDD
jgi:ribosomal protein S28E/S33